MMHPQGGLLFLNSTSVIVWARTLLLPVVLSLPACVSTSHPVDEGAIRQALARAIDTPEIKAAPPALRCPRVQSGSWNPAADGYDAGNALFLALVSGLSYHPEGDLSAVAQRWGFSTSPLISDEQTDTQAYVLTRGTSEIVVFRGTEVRLRDFESDGAIGQVSHRWGRVHKGFLESFTAIWPKIERRLQSPKSRVWFAGHSLGGALATLGAAHLASSPTSHGHSVAGIYSFGSPRVGNQNFARNYENVLGARTFRHVNRNDIVAQVPFTVTRAGIEYRHVGRAVTLKPDGGVSVSMARAEIAADVVLGVGETASALLASRRSTTQSDPIADHALIQYLPALEGAAKLTCL